jgi:hypothetical protein
VKRPGNNLPDHLAVLGFTHLKPYKPEIRHMPREHKPNVSWDRNAYTMGIAQRLKVDPWRVDCDFKVRPGGGFLFEIRVDGRDLTGAEESLVKEYLEEAFHGIKPRIEG